MDALYSCDQGRQCVLHIRELMIMIMRTLRNLKPNDTRGKELLQMCLTNIKKEFQNLRSFCNFCQAEIPELTDLESFIPLTEEVPMKEPSEEYMEACKERDALREEVALRNAELAAIIRCMRTTICRINCELAYVGVDNSEKND